MPDPTHPEVTLRRLLDERRLTIPQALTVLASTVRQVRDHHAAGRMHGALDAGHVLVDSGGEVRLLPPKPGGPQAGDPAVDVRGCGLLLFEILTGQLPPPQAVPDPRAVAPEAGDALSGLCLEWSGPGATAADASALPAAFDGAAGADLGLGWADPVGLGQAAAGIAFGGTPVGTGAGVGASTGAAKAVGVGVGAKVAAGVGAAVVAIGAGGVVAGVTRGDEPQRNDQFREQRATIRDAELDDQKWWIATSGQTVRLRNGKGAFPDDPTWKIRYGVRRPNGAQTRYLDADGDGDEDALAPLTLDGGNGLATTWYFWLWDEETETGTQVRHPVASEGRCGDEVLDIRAESDRVVIEERLRSPLSALSCADPPDVRNTRAVSVVDGVPVLRSGIGGYGGICPFATPGDAYSVDTGTYADGEPYGGGPPYVFRAGPSVNAPVVDDPQLGLFAPYLGYNDDGVLPPYLDVDGWVLVHLGPDYSGDISHFEPYGDTTPCAWLKAD